MPMWHLPLVSRHIGKGHHTVSPALDKQIFWRSTYSKKKYIFFPIAKQKSSAQSEPRSQSCWFVKVIAMGIENWGRRDGRTPHNLWIRRIHESLQNILESIKVVFRIVSLLPARSCVSVCWGCASWLAFPRQSIWSKLASPPGHCQPRFYIYPVKITRRRLWRQR